MKYFFWLSAFTYVVLYFYTAWIYEGFSMTLAIIIFVLVTAFFYWRHKRKVALQAKLQSQPQTSNHSLVNTRPLSFWQTPIPYVGIAAVVIILVGFRL
jgi:MFS superfamily sulfate permease-like transporter